MLSILFCVLLLVPTAFSVCQVCFGEATSIGCKGDATNCPWTTGITQNAEVVASIIGGTAASAVITIASLLPSRFRKVFPRSVLDVIVEIVT